MRKMLKCTNLKHPTRIKSISLKCFTRTKDTEKLSNCIKKRCLGKSSLCYLLRAFQVHDQDKAELYQQLKKAEELNENFDVILKKEQLRRGIMRWAFMAAIKNMKEKKKFDLDAAELIEKILNDNIRAEYDEKTKTLREDLQFLRDENTNLGIDLAELKYEHHSVVEERNSLEEKHNQAINEIYMINRSLENMKTADRKLQSEYESLVKAHEHSKTLIRTLEEDKQKLQNELEKHVKGFMSGILTNIASVEKSKVMHHLSESELQSLAKINKADIKSEYAQTTINDINNILVVKKPDQKDKPDKPSKNIPIQTNLSIPESAEFDPAVVHAQSITGKHHKNKLSHANTINFKKKSNDFSANPAKAAKKTQSKGISPKFHTKIDHHDLINEKEESAEESDLALETSHKASSRLGGDDLHESLSKTMEQRYTKGIRIRTSSSKNHPNFNRTEQMKEDKYGHIFHFVKTNFDKIIEKRQQRLFNAEELEKNDVYHRLFKDSKIKQVQSKEFVEFLKMKETEESRGKISGKFLPYNKDNAKDAHQLKISVQKKAPKMDPSTSCLCSKLLQKFNVSKNSKDYETSTLQEVDDLFEDYKLQEKLDKGEIINANEFITPGAHENTNHNYSSFLTEPVNIQITKVQNDCNASQEINLKEKIHINKEAFNSRKLSSRKGTKKIRKLNYSSNHVSKRGLFHVANSRLNLSKRSLAETQSSKPKHRKHNRSLMMISSIRGKILPTPKPSCSGQKYRKYSHVETRKYQQSSSKY
ncbi:unnamed protein product [Moneuplotes crassus]|uniref:Uncharacterized protein n=1 Tax=Euplotes crassus TaxID=5936 RepID=A0AAD1UD70_EUPCR|nr:unnamed protein product [Moneuplotes crassus]